MIRSIVLLSLSAALSYGSIAEYTNQADWAAAVQGSSIAEEDFANNQINVPGLSVLNCAWRCTAPGIDYIADGAYHGADDKYAHDAMGDWAMYTITRFTLPAGTYAFGFDLNAPQSGPNDPFGVGITTVNGGGGYALVNGTPDEAMSPAYDGFFGVLSTDSAIASFEFDTGGAMWELDHLQLAGTTVAPEPATLGVFGLGLAAVGLFVRRRRA